MYILLHSAIIEPLSVCHSALSFPDVFSSRTVSSRTSQSCQIRKKSELIRTLVIFKPRFVYKLGNEPTRTSKPSTTYSYFSTNTKKLHFFLLIWNSVCRLLIKGQEKTFKQMSNIDKGHLVTFGSSYQNQRRKISSLMRYLLLLLLRSFTKNERIKHALR